MDLTDLPDNYLLNYPIDYLWFYDYVGYLRFFEEAWWYIFNDLSVLIESIEIVMVPYSVNFNELDSIFMRTYLIRFGSENI